MGNLYIENVSLKEIILYIPDQPYFLSQYTTKQMAKFYKSMYPTWSEERFQSLVESFELNVNKKIHIVFKGVATASGVYSCTFCEARNP